MRDGAGSDVLGGVCSWRPVVESWLAGSLLAGDVPVSRGRVVASVTGQVPERLTFTVPRFADGVDWLPGRDPEHPLARFGQELTVRVLVGSAVTGVEYETRLGRFLVTDWQESPAGVDVTAVGLLQRAADDRLPSPLAPRTGGTLLSEFRRLLPAGMSVGVDASLVDRACPRSMEWSEDRLGALYEIADAWPARLRVDQWGQVALRPPLPEVPVPVLTLTDGEGGTVVGAPISDTRERAYNRVVARATVTDDPKKPPIQAVVDHLAGPMSTTGPYGVVTRFWSSPLITTVTQARASAASLLASSLRPSRIIPVEHAPDPRIDLDDPVAVVVDKGTAQERRDWGYVVGYDLPLTVEDGPMRTDVGVGA